ncbi:hypothetical protein [Ramlibacter sp. AN1133]|uniref:hypothetical protein n=1 Tax=Ramlibacter sp. AN1133 TaxID=3133429 RepID=UPI0030C19AF4
MTHNLEAFGFICACVALLLTRVGEERSSLTLKNWAVALQAVQLLVACIVWVLR